jgi:hypothetical protein
MTGKPTDLCQIEPLCAHGNKIDFLSKCGAVLTTGHLLLWRIEVRDATSFLEEIEAVSGAYSAVLPRTARKKSFWSYYARGVFIRSFC